MVNPSRKAGPVYVQLPPATLGNPARLADQDLKGDSPALELQQRLLASFESPAGAFTDGMLPGRRFAIIAGSSLSFWSVIGVSWALFLT